MSGYAETAITIGIVLVACLAARIAWVPDATMMSTFSWTSSIAKVGKPFSLPLRPSPLHRDIAAVDIAQFAQSLAKAVPGGASCAADDTNARNLRGLLRKRGEGRGQKATRERADECAPVDQ